MNEIIGAKQKYCKSAAKIQSGGTGFIREPFSAWIKWGENISGRPVISERGYVVTRRGIEGFRHQLYAEALQRGMLKAEKILVLADGAIWIWNIASDRFKQATQ